MVVVIGAFPAGQRKLATRWWPVACSSFIAECVLRSAPDFERCFLDLALADIRDASTVVSLPGASAIWSKRRRSRRLRCLPLAEERRRGGPAGGAEVRDDARLTCKSCFCVEDAVSR